MWMVFGLSAGALLGLYDFWTIKAMNVLALRRARMGASIPVCFRKPRISCRLGADQSASTGRHSGQGADNDLFMGVCLLLREGACRAKTAERAPSCIMD
jgi:hypothetical protein